MRTGDTIAAIASAPGAADRGVVRLSGPHAFAALDTLLDACALPRGRGVHTVELRVPGSPLTIPTLALVTPGPGSYTGEDACELWPPGAPWLLRAVVDALCARPGVRPAEPGEFSARAFMNGRLTAEQAEAIPLLIGAEHDGAVRAASVMLSGAAGRAYRRAADELTGALALVEAGIDFADEEDVVAISPGDLLAALDRVRGSVEPLLGDGPRETERAGTRAVALVGRPNAGKSTLFNALLGRVRAVTADAAGTTRDVLAEPMPADPATPGAPPIELLDLPGLDPRAASARGSSDAEVQRAAQHALRRAHALVWCDPLGVFDPADLPPHDGHAAVIRVRTKADRPAPRDAGGGGDAPALFEVCALDGSRIDALRRAIGDACSSARASADPGVAPRQRAAAIAAMSCIDDAHRLLEPQRSRRALAEAEAVASLLRGALDALGEITGRVHPDDVLGRIFASFCIGK